MSYQKHLDKQLDKNMRYKNKVVLKKGTEKVECMLPDDVLLFIAKYCKNIEVINFLDE